MPSPLHNLYQQIHATLLSPPTQFLLISTIPTGDGEDDQWVLRLYVKDDGVGGGGGIVVWTTTLSLGEAERANGQGEIADAIKAGLLHVDVGLKRAIEPHKLNHVELHILVQPEPIVRRMDKVDIDDHLPFLLDTTFVLLSRPAAVRGKGDTASELRELRAQVTRKDAEIASLSSKLASMKATVVRATASDNKKKGVNASPQKAKPPKGASALQPNQKRRKAVEDEFAGSSDDEDE